MANIANLVAFDGQSTPVSHTFFAASVARQGSDTIASYKESAAGVPDEAQGRVTIKHSKLGSGVNRVSARVEIPVMEAIASANSSGYTAAPKVAYVDTVEVIGYYHQRSVIANRRSARQLAVNILGGYTALVTPSIVGPTPELFDLLITPT